MEIAATATDGAAQVCCAGWRDLRCRRLLPPGLLLPVLLLSSLAAAGQQPRQPLFGPARNPAATSPRPGSSLPATPPTAATAPAGPETNNLGQPVSTRPAHQAEVSYAGGLLSVRANDSSLNQILRAISRATGMKIVGGVGEQRVFGNYGPAEPATVLATLLDGTGSNMLLRETATQAPAELILTERRGGPSPPSPFSYADDDNRAAAPAEPRPAGSPPAVQLPSASGRSPGVTAGSSASTMSGSTAPAAPAATQPGSRSIPQPWNNVNGSASNTSPTASTLPVTNSVPVNTLPTPSTTPSTRGIVDAPNPPPPGTNNPLGPTAPATTPVSGTTPAPATGTAPSAPKTPQQIYFELQQLMKQKQGATTAPSQGTSPAAPATSAGTTPH